MKTYLGFSDFSIALIYVLNIAVVLFCVLYGWRSWSSSNSEENSEKTADKWNAEEEKINSQF
jgi:hypothetical protein